MGNGQERRAVPGQDAGSELRPLGLLPTGQGEDLSKTLAENCQIAFYVIQDGKFRFVNPLFLRYFGYSEGEVLNRESLAFVHPKDWEHVRKEAVRMLKGDLSVPFEFQAVCRNGQVRWMLGNVTSIQYHGRRAVLGDLLDITDRKHMEEALRESEERYRTLVETSPDAIALLTLDFKIIIANPQTLTFLGYEGVEGGIRKSFLEFLSLEDWPRAIADFKEVVETGRIKTVEYTLYRRRGAPIIVEMRSSLIRDQAENPKALILAVRDITERRRAEEQVKASLQEKEVLLKEIHHRVKNNLQIISSLLRLQSRYIHDERAHHVFQESQNRIRTMALIHEKLYRSSDFARIDFAGYLRDLAANLYRSYGVNPERISLKVQMEEVSLVMDKAIPCGLLVNELLSNCLKHAFADGREGEILVRASSREGQLHLTIQDNGVGFPAGIDFRNTPSLGLQLVITLVEQLEGTIDLRRENGTEFRINFPEGKPKK